MAELNARIIAKASGTSGEAPQPLDLQTAELAVNTADGKLFTKHTDGTIKEVGGSSDVGSINDLSDVQFDVTSTALFYRKGNADNPGEYDQRAGNKAYLYLNQYDASGVNINDILSSGSYDVYVSSDQGQVWVINAGSGVGGNTSVQLDEGARWRLLSTGGGNSWVPGNNDEELSGDIVVSTAADASVTIQPPSDGEILQWDSASQTFRPVSLPSAPVTSVNDETGVVSLGIQDMDDFSLYFDTNTYIFEFDEHSTASYYPYCRPGVIWHSEYYSDRVYFKSDKDGFAANDSANAAIAANGGNAAGVPFWIKQGDNAEWQYRKGVVGTNAGNCSAISITNIGSYGTPSLPITGAIPTYLTFADPVNEPYIPLQDEQVLRWDSTTSEWRPEDLAVVAKTGSYDDLTDLPTIPAAAPVDSVNGATGAVSLGIQDMDDFSLLADDGLGIGTYNVFVGDATNLYNTPGGAGIDFGNRTLPLGYQPGFSQLDADGVDRRAEFETINEGPVWVSINGLPFIQAVGNWETIFNGYLGVDLDGSGAAPDGTVINEVKVTTVEPGIPQPLEDGDYLRWNASSQLFSPAQLPSTSGAVDSVNGETGVVSLGVQDMNDFELVYAPASETWSTPNTGVPGAEQFRLYGAGAARLSTTTANGYRKDELLSYLITGANLEIIVNSVTHTATVTSPAPDLNGAGGPSEYIGVSFNVSPVLTDTDLADSSLVINFLDVGAVDTPLAEGDILQWVDAEQKFKPAQLPTGGGGGGAVDSVNGETGVVSLGIQEMDDFSLNVNTSPFIKFTPGGYTSDGSYSTTASNSYIGAAMILSFVSAEGKDSVDYFSGFSSGTVYYSTDEGLNWTSYSTSKGIFSSFGGEGQVYLTGSALSAVNTNVWFSLTDPSQTVFVPLQESDILQWANAEQKFKPAQLPDTGIEEAPEDGTPYARQDAGWVSSPGNAVDSVNGETGAVSLGIQDMDDFKLTTSIPSGSVYRYDSVISTGNCSQFEVALAKVEGMATLGATAVDVATEEADPSFGAKHQTWTGFEFSTTGPEGPWTSTGVVSTSFNHYNCGGTRFDYDIAPVIGGAQTVWVREIGTSDPQENPLTEGDVLQWSAEYSAFMPNPLAIGEAPEDGTPYVRQDAGWVSAPTGGGGGGGGAVDSVNGQTGAVVLNMDDIENVDSLVEISGVYQTSFEEGEPFPQDPTPTVESVVTYDGQRSVSFDNTESLYGQGNHLKGVFPGNSSSLRYDVVRIYIRSDTVFNASNRQSLGGTKAGILPGGGWSIYTRDTGFAFYGNGSFFEDGTRPSMVADTWYEIIYVIDWENGRDVIPARWSLWVDGAIAVDSSSPGSNGVTYEQPTAPDDTRYYFALSAGTSTGLRYVDKLSVKATDTLPWGISDATLDVNDVTPFFTQVFSSTPDGHTLRYDGVAQKWKTVEYNFESLPQAGYNLFDSDGDPTQPYSSFKPTSLGMIEFRAYTTNKEELWGVYANAIYGVTIGKYHLEVASGGTIADARLRANEARRTYYSDNGITHNMGDKPLWLMGALGTYTDNTPELRWTSGNPGDTDSATDGNYIGLKLPAGITEDTTYTFPPAPIDGGRLMTDPDGNLSWDLTGVGLDLGSPAFAVTSGVAFNYEEDGTDTPTSGGNPPASMSTDSVVGSQSILFNTDIAQAEYLLGYYPQSPYGDPGYLHTKPFTFQTWFKNLSGDITRFHRMISGRDGSNQENQFQIRTSGTAGATQGCWQLHHNALIVSGQTAATDQQWHHLAIQHDGSGTYRMFFDGAPDGVAVLAEPIPFVNGTGFVLGGRGDFSPTTFYQGHLDATELIVGVELYDNTGFTPPTTPAGRTIVLDDRTILDLATISDLDDVDTETTPPTDGQVLVWDGIDQKWKPSSDYVSLASLKAETAASTDFADFQARIAAL